MEFKIAGIGILVVFYACYFIKMMIQNRKGIKTNQVGLGKVGTAKYIELTMSGINFIVPAVEVVSIFLGTSIFAMPVRMAGALIGSIGVIVFIISVMTMQDSWRAGVAKSDQTELVTNGIYQISRNPAFVGFDLIYIGITMMFFNWVLLVVSCLAIVIFHLQIVMVEEVFLVETFEEEYLSYQKNVCRYLGRKK